MAITKYNKNFEATFDGVELEGKKTVALAELVQGTPIRLDAIMFSTKGKFGKSAFVVCGDTIAWLPKHMLSVCEEICADEETAADIKNGKCGMIVRSYEDKKNGKGICYTVDFCDL